MKRQETESGQDAPSPVSKLTDADRARALRVLGLTVALGILACYAALSVGLAFDGSGRQDRWYAFVVPTAGGVVGMLLGFLFAAVGRETERFAGVITALNAAFAGATVADLARDDGLLRQFFSAFAKEVGLPDRPVLVAAVFVSLAAAGFLWMYLFKTLGLNRAIVIAQAEDHDYNLDLKKVNSQIAQSVGNPSEQVVPETVKKAAERVSADKDTNSKDLGKALYLQGRFAEAADALRETLKDTPDDRGAQLYLANTLVAADRQLEAIPYLEQLVADPAAPAVARKLLGYAYFFTEDGPDHREQLERARKLSQEFLKLYPDDWGAALNEACALAQLAQIDKKAYWTELLQAVRNTVKLGGKTARDRIAKDLSAPGQDFYKVASDPEFQRALQGTGN